jgi:hypothetical protein
MTNSNEASKTAIEPDYSTLLHANLERVFNERDDIKRNAAVQELYSPEPTMYEPAGIVTGQAAISEVAAALLEQFGPNFSFVAEGAAVGHHGLGYLKWRAGPANGPVIVSGVDVAEVRGGRIIRLWVLLDAPQG